MENEQEKYDLIIIGGGIAATWLSLNILQKSPEFTILIVEKCAEFPQKVGESLVDMTALLVKSLDIHELLEKQRIKTGIRFLFNESNSVDRAKMAEFASPNTSGRLRAYHLDRKVFDQQLLEKVEEMGATVYRPAEITNSSFETFNNQLTLTVNEKTKKVASRWLADASGRSRFIAQRLKWKMQPTTLNTGAIMAHLENVEPAEKWDTPHAENWERYSVGSRAYSTTHLMRKNCWWWIIRLNEKKTSVGVVFDKNAIQFDDAQTFFRDQLKEDPQLAAITKNATLGEIREVEKVPYLTEKLYTEGVALVGDSGFFLDPLISPGLELLAQQAIYLSDLLTTEKRKGQFDSAAWKKYQATFFKAYTSREKIYQGVYPIIHSFDLMSCWLKQANFIYFGRLVFPAIACKKKRKIPLQLNLFERMMNRYFTRRFHKISQRRIRQGRISESIPNKICYSKVEIPKGGRFVFIPVRLLFLAIGAYLKLELKEMKYLFKKTDKTSR
ncbi:MAG: tryptophan 7-halogenase [Crocinitomicaceae bacterium]